METLYVADTLKKKAEHLTGIVEFDETYFLKLFKGNRYIDREPRNGGGTASKRGILSE